MTAFEWLLAWADWWDIGITPADWISWHDWRGATVPCDFAGW